MKTYHHISLPDVPDDLLPATVATVALQHAEKIAMELSLEQLTHMATQAIATELASLLMASARPDVQTTRYGEGMRDCVLALIGAAGVDLAAMVRIAHHSNS